MTKIRIKRTILLFFMAIMTLSAGAKNNKTVKIRLVETTDVHGCFFPYDYINRKPKSGSMARVSTYLKECTYAFGKNVIALENGDILQGQPSAYYYNYVATDKENIGASIVNYLGFEAQAFGNHDIETGHAVYDKWATELNCPVLAANVVNVDNDEPYTIPYKIIERSGVRICILGMLTPAIPNWLGENLWSGLRFEEMVECSRNWVEKIKLNEKPDIIVGLFHAGRSGGIVTSEYEEDPVERIAKEVPGFDIIFYGHDHIKFEGTVTNCEGKQVWILDPSNNALNVAEADITVDFKKGKIHNIGIEGRIVNVENLPVDEDFMQHFAPQQAAIADYVNRPIGRFTKSIYTKDAFFGSCPFSDFIHNMQLKITGADISFNAPLAFNAEIKEGTLHVSDMFNLYKYENMLCVMRMSGREIRQHLEMSYDLWTNTMKSPDDHIMLLNNNSLNDQQRLGFKNLTFNFDSAAGILYEVDVTKPAGEKVTIFSLSNGEPFLENEYYNVAMNSYRAYGGGELITRGAGIKKADIPSRMVWQSDKDLRYYLMQEIEKEGTMTPEANNNWKFVPEEWTTGAIERDYQYLFGNK